MLPPREPFFPVPDRFPVNPTLVGLSILLVFVTSSCLPSPVQGALPYRNHSIDSDPPGAYDAVAVDMNGDGDTDVVVADGSAAWDEDGGAAWYENLGTNTNFTHHRITTFSEKPRVVVPVDFDGDRDTDIVLGTKNTVNWYENDGTSLSFQEHVVYPEESHSLEVIDFDGDGNLDIVSATNEKYVWYENDGTDLGFTRRVIGRAEGASAVDVADVDRDGDPDLAAAARVADEVVWYENDGTATDFTRHVIVSGEPEADTATDVEMTDLNGNGRPDATVLTRNSVYTITHPWLGTPILQYTEGGGTVGLRERTGG